ncbi:MAG: UTP--glucose-1-phosphate uridylyltransferase GalU [Chloroflexota bacterium]|nr:UTP--glucose-1-phosphate uridylyltransferase GalU [Chloroflexota bacterium]
MNVRKAVIPAAGWGTRFLPVTKAVPKAMLPLLDRPLIQHIVEEAVASGIEHVIIVTYQSRGAIESHFGPSPDLESALEQKGEEGLLDQVRRIPSLADIRYVSQPGQLGLGHAVLTASQLVGNEPFAVLLPDDVFDAGVPVTRQMLEVYERYQGCVIALQEVPEEETGRYGIVKPEKKADRVYQILDMVEKPDRHEAPSRLAILGRYVLTPQVFDALRATSPGKGGEIQLTDALALLLRQEPVYGCEFEGTYYDAGKPLGWLKTSVALALKDPRIGADFRRYVKEMAADL